MGFMQMIVVSETIKRIVRFHISSFATLFNSAIHCYYTLLIGSIVHTTHNLQQ